MLVLALAFFGAFVLAWLLWQVGIVFVDKLRE